MSVFFELSKDKTTPLFNLDALFENTVDPGENAPFFKKSF